MINDTNYREAVQSMRNRTTRLDREGDYWTDDEKEKLRFLFNNGEGIKEIAIQLQRSEPAVMQQIEKMDLYNRKENPRRCRSAPKMPHCLCEDCQLDRAFCPHCTACAGGQEAV